MKVKKRSVTLFVDKNFTRAHYYYIMGQDKVKEVNIHNLTSIEVIMDNGERKIWGSLPFEFREWEEEVEGEEPKSMVFNEGWQYEEGAGEEPIKPIFHPDSYEDKDN